MKMKKNLIVICLLVLLLALSACDSQQPAPTEQTQPTEAVVDTIPPTTTITLNEDGLVLSSGDTFQLSAEVDDVSYASSNEAVATVDANGLISAVGKGNAVITASVDGVVAHCGVIVDLEETSLIDIREQTATLMVAEQYLIHASVLRDFVIVDEEVYYIQRNDSQPSDLVLHHLDENGNTDEWMNLIGFGGGVSISAEQAADGKWYLWVESNGNAASEGQTVSRIPYEPGTTYQSQGGQTWYFNQTEGPVYASVDQENGLVCVRTVCNAGYRFTYYDYESMIAGEELIPLYSKDLSMLTTALDKSINPTGAGVGEHNFRGFAVSGQYIYQYFGTAKSSLLVAVYDIHGEAVYIHKVTEFSDMVFREPDGMYIADGKLYLGLASGESGDRRANIIVYE